MKAIVKRRCLPMRPGSPTIAAAALDDPLLLEVVFFAELTENYQMNKRKDQTM
jgi:hypothetical protein